MGLAGMGTITGIRGMGIRVTGIRGIITVDEMASHARVGP